MRNRSNSGVRLDLYQRIVNKTVLQFQNPVTGLLPGNNSNHAWVRDNLYSILCVWGLALAYKKQANMDEDRAKAYELEQSVVKLMRGLLSCMMKQVDKLETFKKTQNPRDALHAKYDACTGATCVGDGQWGHLQIDATSLYLLCLAEMTASGLQLIFTLDEVAFVQNLVFYIEAAYRIPDYGIWERGDKTNHGLPELNSSSIGMAKAALEAINELDLFGARGGPESVIHVLADESQQCQAILQSMLPRESNSKEVDAGLISIVSFPAFSIDDQELVDLTKKTIVDKLEGHYGFARFIRDGYRTAKEDPNRLHYEPWELKVFEHIECEWPMFFAYLILDGLFNGNQAQVDKYRDALDRIMVRQPDGILCMPESYLVPADKVDAEYKKPHSQERKIVGQVPHRWGQSLYILGRLLMENFLTPGELDPLNRRLVTLPKPDLVVQVVILAEDFIIQERLAEHDLHVQTIGQVSPIQVHPARVLSHVYSLLGKNKKLGLTGRPSSEVGLLATSKLYRLGDHIYAFMPQFMDQLQFYLALDNELLLDIFRTEVDYLSTNWSMLGRPTFIFQVTHNMLETTTVPVRNEHGAIIDYSREMRPVIIGTIQKLKSGYIHGTRVQLGNLSDFLSTSCITKLTFLNFEKGSEDEAELGAIIGDLASPTCPRPHLPVSLGFTRRRHRSRANSVKGIVKRTRSICVDEDSIKPMLPRLENIYREATGVSHHLPDVHMRDPNFGLYVSPGHSPYTSPQSSPPGSPRMSRKKLLTAGVAGIPRSESDLLWRSKEIKEVQGAGIDCNEMVDALKETDSLHEQADIIHWLHINKGPDWDTNIGGNEGVTVNDLVRELYEKAGHLKQWWLVRHTAGMLCKRVEDLAKAVTDLLVRQKQLSVGLPPEPREKIVTRPLPPDELATIIQEACGEDSSTAMLTQELLVYLAMFIRTEPKLFNEMLRLRVGLIIQVMAAELARNLKCSGSEASDHLLNLSPFEMKTLLHHILSGKEFGITTVPCPYSGIKLSIRIPEKEHSRNKDMAMIKRKMKTLSSTSLGLEEDASEDRSDEEKQGQWMRRRRLDGSLNRVPVGFYTKVWQVLERSHGISIDGHILPQNLTREMTPGEFKFAIQVETAFNRIPQPEYRQLMVEAMMVLCLIVEQDTQAKINLSFVIPIDRIVNEANDIFIQDQAVANGDATLCCASEARHGEHEAACGGARGICQHLYDSAPSGRFGSMTYLARAVAQMLQFPVQDGELDCTIS
ncbi:probable phosphorylase b kinase regulatory subunit alpha [Lingula anatina]|uniref:Phosphorylase b kinase regulatory subunit n=1 Tax=Lingula anatina TaxID=7574 RepID=A0A1S3GZL6_LINAN|nr:probable phosphorylase b kinase regulatory subunit alpha [Lingula anatina]|eukprot:XP_013379193.1 probable phosphorylase b kinase regulatory subunit alpha [Lingula anatina]